MFTDRSKQNALRGFTLLEVAIGVTILAVLAGTMFAVVQGSLQAAAEIQMVQRDNRRIDRLAGLLRQYFRTLPPGARMELKMVERSPLVQEMSFYGAPEMFNWGDEPTNREPITLALRRYPDAMRTPDSPEFYLGMTRPSFFQPDLDAEGGEAMPQPMLMNGSLTYPVGQRNLPILADDKGRYWLPILPALRGMTWRFYQTDKKRWIEESAPVKPPLVELVIQPFERNTPIRLVLATR